MINLELEQIKKIEKFNEDFFKSRESLVLFNYNPLYIEINAEKIVEYKDHLLFYDKKGALLIAPIGEKPLEIYRELLLKTDDITYKAVPQELMEVLNHEFKAEYKTSTFYKEYLCYTAKLKALDQNERFKRLFAIYDSAFFIKENPSIEDINEVIELWYSQQKEEDTKFMLYGKKHSLQYFEMAKYFNAKVLCVYKACKTGLKPIGYVIGNKLNSDTWSCISCRYDMKTLDLCTYLWHKLALLFNEPFENDGGAYNKGIADYKNKFAMKIISCYQIKSKLVAKKEENEKINQQELK